MTIDGIKRAFARREEKNWDAIYIFVDLHRTAIKPDYDNKFTYEYYPFAKEALQLMSKLSTVKLGIYTCSHPEEVEKYLSAFKADDINFLFVNENPEVGNSHLGCFTTGKFHFDVLLEDKAGFEAESEWEGILEYLNSL